MKYYFAVSSSSSATTKTIRRRRKRSATSSSLSSWMNFVILFIHLLSLIPKSESLIHTSSYHISRQVIRCHSNHNHPIFVIRNTNKIHRQQQQQRNSFENIQRRNCRRRICGRTHDVDCRSLLVTMMTENNNDGAMEDMFTPNIDNEYIENEYNDDTDDDTDDDKQVQEEVISYDNNDSDGWVAGRDLENDFYQLQQSIVCSNAEHNLYHQERIELLDYIAKHNRKKIVPDLQKYIFQPLIVSLALFLAQRSIVPLSIPLFASRRIHQVLCMVSFFHFWTAIIVVPSIFFITYIRNHNLVRKRQQQQENSDHENDFFRKTSDDEYQQYRIPKSSSSSLSITVDDKNSNVSTRIDPKISCHDYILCLLEQWMSVIGGFMVVFGLSLIRNTKITTTSVRNINGNIPISIISTTPCIVFMQLLLRLCVMLSIHQYPKFLFQLRRTKEQERPIPLSVYTFQTLLSVQFTRWTVPIDLSNLLISLSSSSYNVKTFGLLLYGSLLIPTLALVGVLQYVPSKMIEKFINGQQQWKNGILKKFAKVCILASFVTYYSMCQKNHWNNIFQSIDHFVSVCKVLSMKQLFLHYGTIFVQTKFPTILRHFLMGVVLFGPIWHAYAFSKLVRILYTHGISLSTDVDQFQSLHNRLLLLKNKNHQQQYPRTGTDGNQTLTNLGHNTTTNNGDKNEQDDDIRSLTYAWRYQLRWREPERIRVTLKKWRSKFWYWLFFAGSVQDKLRKEYNVKQMQQSEIKQRRLTIWQRIEDDIAKNDKNKMQNQLRRSDVTTTSDRTTNDAATLITDRTTWKSDAMQRLAMKHQLDYERKDVSDPLGIAIQQTFGIGLGYNFDHMSQLKKDEVPSSRRLQARAAKSALKRVQQLYDSETAKGILNSIQDSNERNVKAAELRNNVETEIQNLAQRLTDLVPNDLSLDNRYNTNIQQYDSSYYERTSSNEYVVNEARVGRRRRTKISPAIENMLLEQEQQSAKPIDDEEQYAKTIDENMMKPYGYEDSALTMYNTSDLVSDSNMTEDEFIEAWLSERKNPPGAGQIGESADKSKSTNDDEEKDDENQKIYLV